MIEYILIFIQIISFIIGVLFIYSGAFLYENEERKIYNYLEDLWIKIDDTSIKTISKHQNFISLISQYVYKKLILLFGEKIISKKSLGVSILLSFSSLLFSLGVVFFVYTFFLLHVFTTPFVDNSIEHYIWVSVLFTVSILLFVSAFAINKWKYLKPLKKVAINALFILTLIICYLYFSIGLGMRFNVYLVFFMVLSILFMVLSDFVFVIFTLKILKKVPSFKYPATSYIFLILNFLFILILVIFPIKISELLSEISLNQPPYRYAALIESMSFAISIIPLSSFPAIFISVLLFFVIIFLYIHKIIWPLISRPIYSLQRFGLFKHKKTLFIMGTIFITFSTSEFIDNLKYFLYNLLHSLKG